jgi:hypothetical protein
MQNAKVKKLILAIIPVVILFIRISGIRSAALPQGDNLELLQKP